MLIIIAHHYAVNSGLISLAHANSDAMRKWLWTDTLNNVGMYQSSLIYLHAAGVVLGVYIVCTILDILRRYYLERPLVEWLYKKTSIK